MTFRDKDLFGGTLMVSHGINEETLQNIVMPCEPLGYYISECKAKMDDTGEFYISYTV